MKNETIEKGIKKLELLNQIEQRIDALNISLAELKVSASAHDQRLYCSFQVELAEMKDMYNSLNSDEVVK